MATHNFGCVTLALELELPLPEKAVVSRLQASEGGAETKQAAPQPCTAVLRPAPRPNRLALAPRPPACAPGCAACPSAGASGTWAGRAG